MLRSKCCLADVLAEFLEEPEVEINGDCGCGGDPITRDSCPNVPDALEDTEITYAMWNAMSTGDMASFCAVVRDPCSIFHQAADGRTGAHWAMEYGRADLAKIVHCMNADLFKLRDSLGKNPRQLKPKDVKIDL